MGQFDNETPLPKVEGFLTETAPAQSEEAPLPPAYTFRLSPEELSSRRNALTTPNRAEAYFEAMKPEVQGREYTAEEYKNMPWSEYIPILAGNVGPGVGNVFSGLADLSYGIGAGAISKAERAMGFEGNKENEAVIDAIGNPTEIGKAILQDYKARYGGEGEGEFWKRLAEDPVSYGMDAATVIPFAGQAIKGASILSDVGRAAKVMEATKDVGRAAKVMEATKYLDPVQSVISAPGAVASKIPDVASIISGVDRDLISKAYQIGKMGDPDRTAAFMYGIRNRPDFEEIANTIEASIKEMGKKASDDYISNIASSSKSTIPVDINSSVPAVDDLRSFIIPGGPAGQRIATPEDWKYAIMAIQRFNAISKIPNPTISQTHAVREAMSDAADIVKDNRLKAKISNIGTSLRDAMTDVDPAYGEAMDAWKGYIESVKRIRSNIGRTTASDATKSNRIMKDFLSGSNMISRIEETPSGQYLSEKIAGMASRPWLGSGPRKVIDAMGGMGAGAIAYIGHPELIAPTLAGAITTSPRIASAVSRALGRVGRYAEPVAKYGEVALKPFTNPLATNLGSTVGNAMYMNDERPGRKTGGRVGTSHEDAADRLVSAAERAKKEISRGTESLLDTPDDHVAAALEIVNRSI